MLRVKVFSGAMHGEDNQRLEDHINGWLADARPAIRQMTQSSIAERVVVTFLYEESHRDAQMRVTSAVVPEAFAHSLNDAELDPADDQPGLLPEVELPY